MDDFALQDGFIFDEPTTVYIDDKDWVWSASQSGGVGFFDGEVWSYLNTEDVFSVIMFGAVSQIQRQFLLSTQNGNY